MISTTQQFVNNQNALVRTVVSKVEVYNGSTLKATYYHNDRIKSWDVQRTADTKGFFGMSYIHRVNIKLLNMDGATNVVTGDYLKLYVGFGNEYITYPKFKVSEVTTDQTTGTLSVTGYDAIYNDYKVSDLSLTAPYTVTDFIDAVAHLLNVNWQFVNLTSSDWTDTTYTEGANLDGSESIRDVLTKLAEYTQTVCYLNHQDKLIFKRMSESISGISLTKDRYYMLDTTLDNRRLKGLCSYTELGDNIEVKDNIEGTMQNLYENPFLTLLPGSEVANILTKAYNSVRQFTIKQFTCEWFGDLRAEIGDRITLFDKSGQQFSHYGYLVNDTIKYDGSLRETTEYQFDPESELEANSASLGDMLNLTYAKVDKVNQVITLRVENLEGDFSQMEQTVDQIETTVSQHTGEISTITQRADEIDQVIQGNATYTEGAQPPQSPHTGDIWKDTRYNTYYKYNGLEWIEITEDEAGNLRTINAIYHTLDGVVYDNGSGTTVINGSNITTGTILADRLALTGEITWSDLASDAIARINETYKQSTPPTATNIGAQWYCTADYGVYKAEHWYTWNGSQWKAQVSDYGDADVEDLLDSTYGIEYTALTGTSIMSPTIYGGELYAGTGSDEGIVVAKSTGLQIHTASSGSTPIIDLKWTSGNYDYPYILLGRGGTSGVDRGMVKKYSNGVWIGDNDGEISDSVGSGTGFFVNTSTNKLYGYRNGEAFEITPGSSTAVFG